MFGLSLTFALTIIFLKEESLAIREQIMKEIL